MIFLKIATENRQSASRFMLLVLCFSFHFHFNSPIENKNEHNLMVLYFDTKPLSSPNKQNIWRRFEIVEKVFYIFFLLLFRSFTFIRFSSFALVWMEYDSTDSYLRNFRIHWQHKSNINPTDPTNQTIWNQWNYLCQLTTRRTMVGMATLFFMMIEEEKGRSEFQVFYIFLRAWRCRLWLWFAGEFCCFFFVQILFIV